jgi:hypothetical protein
VLAHPGADGRVADLEEQRISGGGEEACIARNPPGDTAAGRDEPVGLLPGRQFRIVEQG